jgi:hypothetical protein
MTWSEASYHGLKHVPRPWLWEMQVWASFPCMREGMILKIRIALGTQVPTSLSKFRRKVSIFTAHLPPSVVVCIAHILPRLFSQ